jgi:hypothetical protein
LAVLTAAGATAQPPRLSEDGRERGGKLDPEKAGTLFPIRVE